MAERSYPISEVSGSREEIPHVRGRGWGVAKRRHPGFEVRGSGPEEQTSPEARGGSREEQSEELWLRGDRRAYRSYPMLKVRKGGAKEIPFVQGKEQRLCFVGAAVKRYPTPEVRETPVRQ